MHRRRTIVDCVVQDRSIDTARENGILQVCTFGFGLPVAYKNSIISCNLSRLQASSRENSLSTSFIIQTRCLDSVWSPSGLPVNPCIVPHDHLAFITFSPSRSRPSNAKETGRIDLMLSISYIGVSLKYSASYDRDADALLMRTTLFDPFVDVLPTHCLVDSSRP